METDFKGCVWDWNRDSNWNRNLNMDEYGYIDVYAYRCTGAQLGRNVFKNWYTLESVFWNERACGLWIAYGILMK